MSLETEKVPVPLWIIVVLGLVVVTAIMAAWYYWLDDQSVKMIGLAGGVVSGLIVYILTFATMVRPIQELDRYKRMGIKSALRNRHDKDYYGRIVANARKDVRVMGASCTRFVEDFLDLRGDDRVLVDALHKNPTLRVQLLVPQEQYMPDPTKARALGKLLDPLRREFGDRVELRRFGEKATHGFVIVDDDLIAGPIFEGERSKYAPAVHVGMWTDFARKYSSTSTRSGKTMRPDEEVSIRIRPRVHLGLISMHEGGPRRNGGIGFSLQEPGAIVTGTPATKFALVDERELGFGENEATQLRATADEAVAADTLSSNVAIRISGGIRTHVGMGSGTAIRLAVLEVIYVINGRPRPREHLVARSARGGTSGIGINTYFDGGLILDLGVKSGPGGFFPSSSIRPATVPTALPRLAMPEWPMCLCLPRSIRPKSQNEELDFFKRTAPVDPAASFRAAYDALFGIYAAVADADHEAFCRAVTSIQHTTWKNAEWREYGVQLERLRDDLACLGADCVGMSSLGPMLFCLGDPTILDEVVRRQDALDCEIVRTVPDNAGRVVLQARHA